MSYAFDGMPFENIGFVTGNFRVAGAQLPGDFQGRGLSINSIDLDPARQSFERNRQSIAEYRRNLAARSTMRVGAPRLNPTAHKAQNKTIAAEPAIELPDTFQVALQLGRNRLRPIHHFKTKGSASLH